MNVDHTESVRSLEQFLLGRHERMKQPDEDRVTEVSLPVGRAIGIIDGQDNQIASFRQQLEALRTLYAGADAALVKAVDELRAANAELEKLRSRTQDLARALSAARAASEP